TAEGHSPAEWPLCARRAARVRDRLLPCVHVGSRAHSPPAPPGLSARPRHARARRAAVASHFVPALLWRGTRVFERALSWRRQHARRQLRVPASSLRARPATGRRETPQPVPRHGCRARGARRHWRDTGRYAGLSLLPRARARDCRLAPARRRALLGVPQERVRVCPRQALPPRSTLRYRAACRPEVAPQVALIGSHPESYATPLAGSIRHFHWQIEA